jgi:hypothetical protein
MNCARRIATVFLGAVGLAVFAVSSTLSAQPFDNRPVYYLMLKSLEEGFEAYNAALAADLKVRASNQKAGYDAERRAVTKTLALLEEERAQQKTQFNTERNRLNGQIDAVHERIALSKGRIKEELRIQQHHSPRYANDPRISALKEQVAEQLAAIDAMRASYVVQLAATQEARAALTAQIEEYVSAGDPLALEIRSLNEDWRRFSEKERRKLKRLADAYAVDYAAYDKWLEDERAVVEDMSASLANTQKIEREQRALHAETETLLRERIDEYNALVELHNKAEANDPGRDERATKFAALEIEIAELQRRLSGARDAVIRTVEELRKTKEQLTEHFQRFASAKQVRDTTLAADLAEINTTGLAVEAAIDERRQEVDAQIKTLESHISAELSDARQTLETLNARMLASFGRDHDGLDAAIARVLEMNDDKLLYTASGEARFDLSRPKIAEVFTAVEQLEAYRREIDTRIAVIEKGKDGAPQKPAGEADGLGALERELAGASDARQRLLEAYAVSAREGQAQSVELEGRLRAIDTRFAEQRRLLAEVYSARAGLTRTEMQAVQQVLVAAAKGGAIKPSGSSDYMKLLDALNNKATHLDLPLEASLLAPHTLMDGLASRVPSAHPGVDDPAWVDFSSRKITASRELTGADKAKLASAWLAALRRQTRFAEVGRALDASGAVENADKAVSTLFMAGVIDHTVVQEQELDDGGIGIQVIILGREYLLDPGGSLQPLSK